MASLKITAPLTREWAAANARAIANAKAGRRAERIAEKTYAVTSSKTNTTYTVGIDSIVKLQATCTCPHGSRTDAKGICWHKSAAIAAAITRCAENERKMARFGRQ